MKFRHEWKHEINGLDMHMLRPRLRAVMELDAHAKDGKYEVRSLYFDNWQDKALMEKINGINFREKFRLRCYNGNTSFILLEKKSKINGLCKKEQQRLSLEEVKALISHKGELLPAENKPLLQELQFKMRTQGLNPKTIVDYTREAFVYGPGNVRVTLDYNIRTEICGTDFLNADCVTVPAGSPLAVLEVKWDEFLPSVIRDIIQLKGRRSAAFSKYAACRIYG